MNIVPQCFDCKHYIEGYGCSAFKDEIPMDILLNKFIHDKPHPDQINDLLFESTTEEAI